MILKRTLIFSGSLLGRLFLASCTTITPEQVSSRAVYREMPAPVLEVRPAQPTAAYNWVPGHYAWAGDQWRWQPGYYVQAAVRPMPPVLVERLPLAPSPRHFYVQGHWQWGGADWVWVRGHWVEG